MIRILELIEFFYEIMIHCNIWQPNNSCMYQRTSCNYFPSKFRVYFPVGILSVTLTQALLAQYMHLSRNELILPDYLNPTFKEKPVSYAFNDNAYLTLNIRENQFQLVNSICYSE